MNKDQAEGASNDAQGKVQEQLGESTGSTQGEGKAQSAYGNVKEALRNSRHE